MKGDKLLYRLQSVADLKCGNLCGYQQLKESGLPAIGSCLFRVRRHSADAASLHIQEIELCKLKVIFADPFQRSSYAYVWLGAA